MPMLTLTNELLAVGVCVPVADRLSDPALTVEPSPTKAWTPPPVLAEIVMTFTEKARLTSTSLIEAEDVTVPVAVREAAPDPRLTTAFLPMRASVVWGRNDL